jgi:acetyl-CoA synthetase/medium-chain acyl-CoA synthetase
VVLRRRRKSDIPRAGPFPPGWDVPARFNFTRDVVEALAAGDTLRKGVAYVDREGIVDRRSFSDVAKDAARWALLLRTRLDRGDRVLVVLGKVPAWHGAMLGALKGGLVAVPCSEMLRARDLAFRVKNSGARLVIADRSCEAEVQEMLNQVDGGVTVVYLDEALTELQRYVPRAPTEETTAGDAAFILYTSGTTKEPKGVVHTHAYTWAQRAQAGHWLDAHEQDVIWCTAGTGWAKSIWNVLLGPWSHGAEADVHEGAYDPEQRLSLLERLGVTVLCQAPTEYRMLAKLEALQSAHLPRLRHAVSAGEPLNPEVIERFQQTLGLTIHDGYGQTENSLLVANAPGAPVRAGSMGLTTPGHDVAVIDDAGHVCPPGVEGEIALNGRPPTLVSGYWDAPDETAAVFEDGWYRTGDRATRDEEGYFWFVGRADDVILSAAYRIGPFEVESALLEHPAVAESAVVGVPHAERGQIVKAFVVLRPGTEGDDALATELQEHVKAITAPYKYPRAIEFVPELPKTPSGKIRRADLRALPHVEAPVVSSVVQLPVRRRDDAAEEAARAAAARVAEEEAARAAAEEAARVEAEAAARAEAEAAARAQAAEAERVRAEAEAQALVEAEEAARREAEEAARLEAEAVALRDAEERAEAEATAAREAEEERLRAQAAEAAEVARLEAAAAAAAAAREAEAAAAREAEEASARAEVEEAARLEAEERERAAAEEAARSEAQAVTREAEARAQEAAQEAARLAAEAAAAREAEERALAAAPMDAEELARVEAEIARYREAADRARLEARAAEAVRRAAEVQALGEATSGEATAQPSGRGFRAGRDEAKAAQRAAEEQEKRRRKMEEELAKREAEEARRHSKEDAELARQRAKEDAALAKQRAKHEATQKKIDARAAAKRAKDNAALAERRAKEEAKQRKLDEAAAREEARRRAEEDKAAARQREREERAKKSRSEFTRFLFGGEEPEEVIEDDGLIAPIPGLVERLQRYSGQETVPQPPDDFLGGGSPPPEPAPADPAELVDEIPLVEDEERGSRSH